MDAFQACVVVLPLILLISTLPQLQFTSTASTSFSLKLIHRDSIESPLYPGNLTFHERVLKYSKFSESRIAYLTSITKHNRACHPDMMHPYVFFDHYLYLVQVGIGKPHKNYLLVLDTGSDLVWTQCQPCESCFHQNYTIYDPRNSSTYRKVPCDNPLCKLFHCINGSCSYEIGYMDGSSSKGIASWETFTFVTHNEGDTTISDVLFGCSSSNQGFLESQYGRVSGMLGLSKGQRSLIRQLGSFTESRFSYCFFDAPFQGGSPVGYLKFGTDMGYRGGPVQTTPFVNHSNNLYYLNLLDISVDKKRLNYPPHTFDIKPTGQGGCFIDSGTVLTFIQRDAYWKLHMEFKYYFDRFQLERDPYCPSPFELCYKLPADFNSFPSMTFHFQGANLTIEPEHVFMINREKGSFFLAIVPDNDVNVLGLWQQRNTRFVYDLGINSLWFVPENCAEDKG